MLLYADLVYTTAKIRVNYVCIHLFYLFISIYNLRLAEECFMKSNQVFLIIIEFNRVNSDLKHCIIIMNIIALSWLGLPYLPFMQVYIS